MTELHVNVDHIATLRQARQGLEPNPIDVVRLLERTGVSGITTHLREDRRHIQDYDIFEIDSFLRAARMSLTFEMSATKEMCDICMQTSAKLATLVPENREEVTTEGGLDLKANSLYLNEFIKPIQDKGIEVSFFIDPDLEQINLAKQLGAEFIELHTGTYANLFLQDSNLKSIAQDQRTDGDVQGEINRIRKAAAHAQSLGLNVNFGHGLTVKNLPYLMNIPSIRELHIGHSIIANSVYKGIMGVCNDFLRIIEGSQRQ